MPITLLFILLGFSLLRILLASLFPLTADEAYYWLWSKHLSLSYVDHPPMTAYINFLATFGKENLFALRMGTVVISFLVSILIYFLAKEVFEEKVAFWSAVLFQLIPHFLIIWLTMFVELPLILFWTASLYLLARIIKQQNSFLWYGLAITIGLGYLSKYTMFLFWPCLSLFFLLSPAHRFWLKRKEPYLCLCLSLLFFLPVLYWNAHHHWISFTFHSGKIAADSWGTNFLPFIGDQLVHFTPFLLFILYPVFRYAVKKNDGTKLLFAFSFLPLFFFLLLSLKIKVWAHWPSVGYIAALPLTVSYLKENGKSLKKFALWISGFSFLLLFVLLLISPGIVRHQKDYAQNYRLSEKIPADVKIFAKTNVSASLLEFYTRRPTYLATGFLKTGSPCLSGRQAWGEKQYEIWGIPNLKKGETVFYYGEDNPAFRALAAKYFQKTSLQPELRLHLIEDYISNNYYFFKLEGYKGGNSHP